MSPALDSPAPPARGRAWLTLARRADFLRVAATGLRFVTPGFILQAGPCALHQGQIQVGFTASRKVGNAVARNRAKRRLRALADRVIATEADPGLDYVLIGRTEALTRKFATMEQDLRVALKRIVKAKPRGAS
jgi:ribonuclease P protein component